MTVPFMAELDEWTDQLTKDIQSFEGDWQKYHGKLLDLNARIIEIYDNAPGQHPPEEDHQGPSIDNPKAVENSATQNTTTTKYTWSIIMGHFSDAIKTWQNKQNGDEDIIKVYKDDQNEQDGSAKAKQSGLDVQILNFPFTAAYDEMYESWQSMRRHLETFTFEREKQTKRIVGALEEVDALKKKINAEQTQLREEQEQMRKEQAVLREYFDTLKSQNEALLATRSAPTTGVSSTLNEIKELVKDLKDE